MNLDEVKAAIVQLEEETQAIYQDGKVTAEEHPRLKEIEHEMARLWDLRRRLEAARNAGLDQIPVPPPENPEALIG